jgi:lipoprotein-anchoring transpeptidase ErfK/SrfK
MPPRLLIGVVALITASACGHARAPVPSASLVPALVPSPVASPKTDSSELVSNDERSGVEVVASRELVFDVFRQPGPGAVLERRIDATNDWAQPLWLPVTASFRDAEGTEWLRVRLPIRPNGTQGWVRRQDVRTRSLPERIVVDLSDHTLKRYMAHDVVGREEIAVGAPATPTPAGRFFVWAHVRYSDPSGPYGVFALGLSGFSNVIADWTGGGRLAIHGTADPSDAGNDVSHGCVRVVNSQMRALEDVPLGTPVTIRP